jgi:hypothetical protein
MGVGAPELCPRYPLPPHAHPVVLVLCAAACRVQAEFPSGKAEKHTATLVQYTEGGVTSMARTVGLTAAIAAQVRVLAFSRVPSSPLAVVHGSGCMAGCVQPWLRSFRCALRVRGAARVGCWLLGERRPGLVWARVHLLRSHTHVLCPPPACLQLILDGKTTELGVISPMTAQWYVPILQSLHKEGVDFRETVSTL